MRSTGVGSTYQVNRASSLATAPRALPRGLTGTAESVGRPSRRVAGLKLARNEINRRMLHMLPGFLPLVLVMIPHLDPWGPILTDIVVGLIAMVVIPSLIRFSAFARPGEANGFASVLGYVFPILLALCLFRGSEEIAMMVVAILAFGDGSATLGGITFGGRRLPWNAKKTLTGLMFFLGVGGLMATIAFWGESRPGVSWTVAAVCGVGTTLAAAIAESVPLKTNDNLRVGLTAVISGAVLHFLMVP